MSAQGAASVRSLTACKLYVLSRAAFEDVFRQFPDMRDSLEATAAQVGVNFLAVTSGLTVLLV